MDDEAGEKIGSVAGKLVQTIMELGLTWNEAVAAFGLAARATAQTAASAQKSPGEDYVSIARQQLIEAFEVDVRVIVTTSPSDDVGEEADDNPLLATALRRHGSKLH